MVGLLLKVNVKLSEGNYNSIKMSKFFLVVNFSSYTVLQALFEGIMVPADDVIKYCLKARTLCVSPKKKYLSKNNHWVTDRVQQK